MGGPSVLVSSDRDDPSTDDPGSVQERLRTWWKMFDLELCSIISIDTSVRKEITFGVNFRLGAWEAERLVAEDFLLRILRTDFRDTPPEGEWAGGSITGDVPENSLGVGGRRADLSADFADNFVRGVEGWGVFVESEGNLEDVAWGVVDL